jgi:hypothetical protein
MASVVPRSPRGGPRVDALTHPLAYGLLLGTSFIGICWLVDPLCVRLGWTGDFSRPHLAFIGGVFAILMTLRARRHASASRPSA